MCESRTRVTRRARRLLLLGLALAGGIQLGQALYIPIKAQVAQWLLQRAWDETRSGERVAKPWPWADTWPVARLQVPHLQIDQIVLAGANGASLAFGPGHVSQTALPGHAGMSLISAHRDTHFAFLAKLEAGMDIIITRPDGGRVTYRVLEAQVVHQDRFALSQAGPLERSLLLSTCYPFEALQARGPLRYVVQAVALDDRPTTGSL